MSDCSDLNIGAVVLVGDHNWRAAGFWLALDVLLFGRVERFEHLGMKCTVRWLNGKPYLTSLREVKACT